MIATLPTVIRKLALAALMVAALLGPSAPRAMAADETATEKQEIADHMGLINDNYKKLRRVARNKEFTDESVKLAAEMVTAAQASKEMVPPMAEKITDKAEKEKFIADYRKAMDAMIAQLQGLETALKEKRFDEAAKMIEDLNTTKKEGHDKFVEE